MTRDQFIFSLASIGWNVRPVRDPAGAAGDIPDYRVVNAQGEGTALVVTSDALKVEPGGIGIFGPSASRTGCHGSIQFQLDKCELDVLGSQCVSVHVNGAAFVNLYNHDKAGRNETRSR